MQLKKSEIRHNNVALRYKNAEIKNVEDKEKVKTAILKGLEEDSEVLYVLVNYTALFSTQNILKSLEGEK